MSDPITKENGASRKLGPFTVSEIGLGCMNLSHGYGTRSSDEEASRLLNEAIDLGYSHLDTAALYGFGHNEQLIGRTISHRRSEYTLASKCVLVKGEDGKRAIDGRPERIKATCEQALKNLQTDVIDLYYLHRPDPNVPVEDSAGAVGRLVEEGKVRTLGLSEMSSDDIRRANKEHPVAAVQTEYSLWTRNPEISVLETCKELGITFVAFSPVARAFLTGKFRDVSNLADGDIRKTMPRFQPENFARNLELLKGFEALAREAGCSMAQLALAWVLNRGDHIVAIPGTQNIEHMRENFGANGMRLSEDVIAEADELINQGNVVGNRYNEAGQSDVTTEKFPEELENA
ncbi:MAG: aldo/keto reductase [Nitratireductor sp.]|nr:aldo/keto reductase [Nitratireductor sp.]MCC0020910.1 aldo/keto reductase [Nitratireductor sp.]